MGVDLTADTHVKIFADNFSVIRPEHKIPPICFHPVQSHYQAISRYSKVSNSGVAAVPRDLTLSAIPGR